jgi:hypothetical protein
MTSPLIKARRSGATTKPWYAFDLRPIQCYLFCVSVIYIVFIDLFIVVNHCVFVFILGFIWLLVIAFASAMVGVAILAG